MGYSKNKNLLEITGFYNFNFDYYMEIYGKCDIIQI